jgi:hypothetical protein
MNIRTPKIANCMPFGIAIDAIRSANFGLDRFFVSFLGEDVPSSVSIAPTAICVVFERKTKLKFMNKQNLVVSPCPATFDI